MNKRLFTHVGLCHARKGVRLACAAFATCRNLDCLHAGAHRDQRTFALFADAAHCVSLHKTAAAAPTQNSMEVDGAAAPKAAPCSRSMVSTVAASEARLGWPHPAGATGPERPKSPGNAPHSSWLSDLVACTYVQLLVCTEFEILGFPMAMRI